MGLLTLRTRIMTALKRSIRARIWLAVALCVVAVATVAVTNYKIMEDTAELPRQLLENPDLHSRDAADVDEVPLPGELRQELVRALEMAQNESAAEPVGGGRF